MTAKLCKDCKHYQRAVPTKAGTRHDDCLSPKNASLVTGGPRRAPEELRYSMASDACREVGDWWEEQYHDQPIDQ